MLPDDAEPSQKQNSYKLVVIKHNIDWVQATNCGRPRDLECVSPDFPVHVPEGFMVARKQRVFCLET